MVSPAGRSPPSTTMMTPSRSPLMLHRAAQQDLVSLLSMSHILALGTGFASDKMAHLLAALRSDCHGRVAEAIKVTAEHLRHHPNRLWRSTVVSPREAVGPRAVGEPCDTPDKDAFVAHQHGPLRRPRSFRDVARPRYLGVRLIARLSGHPPEAVVLLSPLRKEGSMSGDGVVYMSRLGKTFWSNNAGSSLG